MARMQPFPVSVPMGAYQMQPGGMGFGQVPTNGMDGREMSVDSAASHVDSNPADAGAMIRDGKSVTEDAAESPDNDLIDFDAF